MRLASVTLALIVGPASSTTRAAASPGSASRTATFELEWGGLTICDLSAELAAFPVGDDLELVASAVNATDAPIARTLPDGCGAEPARRTVTRSATSLLALLGLGSGAPPREVGPISFARVIAIDEIDGTVVLRLDRGRDDGVEPGWQGGLVDPSDAAAPRGTFTVGAVTRGTSVGRLPGSTTAAVRDVREVRLRPGRMIP